MNMVMKTLISTLKSIAIFTTLSFYTVAYSQDVTIPFCGDLKVIDAKMGSQISLLKGYSDFQQATLSKGLEGYTLRITYKIDGIFQFESKVISESDLGKICQEIAEISIKKSISEEDMSQEARRRFIASMTTFSLGYYGWAIPQSFGAEDGKAYVASYMFVGGGGFFIPLLATRERSVTDGMARAYAMGAALGIGHGHALTMLMQGDNIEYKTTLGMSVAFSLAESIGGLALAKNQNYTWGHMSSVGSGGIWGYALGAGITMLLTDEDKPLDVNALGLSMLAFSGAGMYGGSHLYSKQQFTHGDVSVINSYGLLGAYYPLAMISTFDSEDHRVYISGVILGASAGIALGVYKSKDYNYTRQQGNLIATGEIAGWLIGAGFAVLFESEAKGVLWLTALGATGGLVITDNLLRGSEKSFSTTASNFQFHINPSGLINAFSPSISAYKPCDPRYSNHFASLRLSF
jgi:hypothetical protein